MPCSVIFPQRSIPPFLPFLACKHLSWQHTCSWHSFGDSSNSASQQWRKKLKKTMKQSRFNYVITLYRSCKTKAGKKDPRNQLYPRKWSFPSPAGKNRFSCTHPAGYEYQAKKKRSSFPFHFLKAVNSHALIDESSIDLHLKALLTHSSLKHHSWTLN